MLAVLAFLGFGALAGPAHSEIKSIGIIAAVGDTCMFEHVRDAPFQWIGPPDATFLEITDWGIDDEVATLIAAALAPKYSIQAIPIEHQVFDTWTDDLLTRRVRELPIPETPVDAYLLVLRDWEDDAIGGTEHALGGLGLYRRDFARGGTRVAVFASYRLVLMEPEHGRILATHAAQLPDGRLPTLAVSSSLWPHTQNDLTDGQRDTLRADFLALIGKSIRDTIRRLGLSTK